MKYTKLLKQINSVGDKLRMLSITDSELITPPNKSGKTRAMYLALQAKGFINLVFDNSGRILFVERKPECLAYKFDSSLSECDKWRERLWGFILGVASAVLAWVLTEYLLPAILR